MEICVLNCAMSQRDAKASPEVVKDVLYTFLKPTMRTSML